MITARFPFWRTNFADFDGKVFWPALTGSLAVLIGGPLLGLGLLAVDATVLKTGSNVSLLCELIGTILLASPMFSWIALIVAVPASDIAARAGFAGWGVAAALGLLGGLAIAVLIWLGLSFFVTANFWPTAISQQDFAIGLAFPLTGFLLALLYWLALRLFYPSTLGIIPKMSTHDPAK